MTARLGDQIMLLRGLARELGYTRVVGPGWNAEKPLLTPIAERRRGGTEIDTSTTCSIRVTQVGPGGGMPIPPSGLVSPNSPASSQVAPSAARIVATPASQPVIPVPSRPTRPLVAERAMSVPYSTRVRGLGGLALPVPQQTFVPPSNQVVLPPGYFIDGARIKVGPFLLNPTGQVIHTSIGQLARVDGGKFLQNLVVDVGELSDKLGYTCGGTTQSGGSYTTGYCTTQWGPLSRPDCGSRCIQPVLNVSVVNGDKPLYKVKNPLDNNSDWGLYVKFDRNTTGSSSPVVITFKKVDRNWFQELWDFLKSIVGVIVDSIQGLINIFRDVSCLVAKKFLDDIARAVQSKVPVSAETKAALVAAGFTAEIQANMTFATAQSLVDKITSKFCGGPPPPPPADTKSGNGLVVVAAAGGAAALLYFMLR